MTHNIKTRHEISLQLADYLGKGKEMCLSELPTLRDCLMYGLFVKETDPSYINKNVSTKILARDILVKVKEQWQRSNTKFQPPVIIGDKTILDKLVTFWDKATRIAWKKITNSQDITKFEEQLDKLFDITKCRCPLLHC